jgi:hypothetical protein
MVAAVSKDGILYLVDAHNFGGMNSQLAMLTLATSGAMAIHTTPAAYATAQGTHVVLTVNNGAQCTGAGANGKAVISVLITPGSPPVPNAVWCIPVENASLGFPASPMATTTDGMSNAIVWFVNGTKLMGVDGDTGETIFGGGLDADACAGVHKWTAPIAVKGRIVVAGDNHLCSWSPR